MDTNIYSISGKNIFLLVSLILLVGCMPATTQELRDISPEAFTFETTEGYKAVYQKVFGEARRRYGRKSNVQGYLYTDNKSGVVTINTPADIITRSTSIYMSIDIKGLSENLTRVTSYYMPGWRNRAMGVENWIK